MTKESATRENDLIVEKLFPLRTRGDTELIDVFVSAICETNILVNSLIEVM